MSHNRVQLGLNLRYLPRFITRRSAIKVNLAVLKYLRTSAEQQLERERAGRLEMRRPPGWMLLRPNPQQKDTRSYHSRRGHDAAMGGERRIGGDGRRRRRERKQGSPKLLQARVEPEKEDDDACDYAVDDDDDDDDDDDGNLNNPMNSPHNSADISFPMATSEITTDSLVSEVDGGGCSSRGASGGNSSPFPSSDSYFKDSFSREGTVSSVTLLGPKNAVSSSQGSSSQRSLSQNTNESSNSGSKSAHSNSSSEELKKDSDDDDDEDGDEGADFHGMGEGAGMTCDKAESIGEKDPCSSSIETRDRAPLETTGKINKNEGRCSDGTRHDNTPITSQGPALKSRHLLFQRVLAPALPRKGAVARTISSTRTNERGAVALGRSEIGTSNLVDGDTFDHLNPLSFMLASTVKERMPLLLVTVDVASLVVTGRPVIDRGDGAGLVDDPEIPGFGDKTIGGGGE